MAAELLDRSATEHDDHIAVSKLVELVGHESEGTLTWKLKEGSVDLYLHVGIKLCSVLIKGAEPRTGRDRPRDADELLLTSREALAVLKLSAVDRL